MKSIALLHPFSAQAIGLKEKDLYFYHSKPHENSFRTLKKEGYDVTIDYFTGKLLPYQKQISGLTKRFWPITKPFFKHRHRWRKQESKFHYRLYSRRAPDITIINMSGHGSMYCFKLARLLKQQNKPYLAMIGGIHMSDHSEAMHYYSNAHHLIVHTAFQKNQLKTQAAFKDLDIRVIPLGVDTDLFCPSKHFKNNFKLLFVGRISRLKQIEKGIEALDYLINKKQMAATLDIIGPVSDEAYFTELKNQVKSLKLQESVTFIGSLKQEELIPYYQAASVLVLPSQHESFGMVMVEAMSCGTPVVALEHAGGPDEIVVSGKNGFLCNPSDFNTKVYELLSTKQLFLNCRRNSRQFVLSNWSLEHTTQCFRASVEAVLNK